MAGQASTGTCLCATVELASIQVAVQAALRLDASFANGVNAEKNPVTKVVNLIKDMQVRASYFRRSGSVQDAFRCFRGRPCRSLSQLVTARCVFMRS